MAFFEQVRDSRGQPGLELVDRQQQAGAVRSHQITRAAGVGGDHRQPRRLRFLDNLAERLVLTGMHKDVHAGIRRGEILAIQRAGENCCGHCRLQFTLVDAVADDDDLDGAAGGQHGESFDVLLRRKPAHKSDDRLVVRRPFPPQSIVACRRRVP